MTRMYFKPEAGIPGCGPRAGAALSVLLASRKKAVFSVSARLLCLVLLSFLASAQTAEERQTRVDRLEHAVLAPCCYTEPVAVHQSEIAVKMRLEIAKWVGMGKSDKEILDTYVSLYGGKVLARPRPPAWWISWVPWTVLAMGTVLLAWFVKRWLPKAEAQHPMPDRDGGSLPDIAMEDDDAAV